MAGLTVSLIFIVFVLADAVYGECRLYWTPSIGDTCMKVSNTYDTWRGAKYSCQSLGGDLITLETRRKEYFVKGWLSSVGWLGTALWIGAHEPNGGVWEWDGMYKGLLSTNDWSYGEPNNDGEPEDCMSLHTTAKWNDESCSTRMRYICEIKATP